MSDNDMLHLVQMFALVVMAALAILFLFSVLRQWYFRYQKKAAQISRSTKGIVVEQSRKVKEVWDIRKAEHELDRLIKLREAGIISDSEFEMKAAGIKELLRANALK